MTIAEASTEWTSGGRVAGLLRAIVSVPADRGDEFDLRVTVDDQLGYEGKVHRHHDGRLHVNFNTHLLENGLRRLGIEIEGPDGRFGTARDTDIRNEGKLADEVRDALMAANVPMIYPGDCDSGVYQPASNFIHSWTDEPDAGERIARLLDSGEITDAEAGLLRNFLRDGFVVLNEKLPETMISAANAALDTAVATSYQGYVDGSSQRLEQMHVTYPAIRDIWLHPPVHRFLSLVFGAESQPCQSLVYVYGSQQDAHQDTIHLTPFPAGMMCGVWIALEDVRPDSGELAVYPGSHRLPRVYMKDAGASKVRGDWTEFGEKVVPNWRNLLKKGGFTALPYHARKGDILIWHENLMHEGSIRRNAALSRRSVVTHNFAKGAIVYYDSSGNVGHIHDSAD